MNGNNDVVPFPVSIDDGVAARQQQNEQQEEYLETGGSKDNWAEKKQNKTPNGRTLTTVRGRNPSSQRRSGRERTDGIRLKNAYDFLPDVVVEQLFSFVRFICIVHGRRHCTVHTIAGDVYRRVISSFGRRSSSSRSPERRLRG